MSKKVKITSDKVANYRQRQIDNENFKNKSFSHKLNTSQVLASKTLNFFENFDDSIAN